MAANVNPNLSTASAAPSEGPSEEKLPVVEVHQSGNFVVVTFSEQNETRAPLDRTYTNEPFNLRVINSLGVEPFIKTFGSILGCTGGFLTFGAKRYRIQVVLGTAGSSDLEEKVKEKHKKQAAEDYKTEHQMWFLCSGTVQRSKSSAGDRFKLVKLARGGYYPQGKSMEDAFKVEIHPTQIDLRLIVVSVVFLDENAANLFVAAVHSYVTRTHGLVLHDGQDFQCTPICAFHPKSLVLETHYMPRAVDGEPPKDAPVWNVELSSVECTTTTSYYTYDDTVFKYQRIETENAFARSIPEGAHIFPRAKCHGIYKWLDEQEFNRLALSGPGHQQYDGTGRGRGKRAKTNPMVTIEPTGVNFMKKDGVSMACIGVRLWCRNDNVADAWRPFLPNDVTLNTGDPAPRYNGLYIYCDQNRRQVLLFEEQQIPNGEVEPVCMTAIPGVDDPSALSTWEATTSTVAVYEIMMYLMKWNHADTLKTWSEEKG